MLAWRPSMPTSAFRMKDPPQAFSTFGFLPSSQLSLGSMAQHTLSRGPGPLPRPLFSLGCRAPCPKERMVQARSGLLLGGLRKEGCHFPGPPSPPRPPAPGPPSTPGRPAAERTRRPAPSGLIRVAEIRPRASALRQPPRVRPPPTP